MRSMARLLAVAMLVLAGFSQNSHAGEGRKLVRAGPLVVGDMQALAVLLACSFV